MSDVGLKRRHSLHPHLDVFGGRQAAKAVGCARRSRTTPGAGGGGEGGWESRIRARLGRSDWVRFGDSTGERTYALKKHTEGDEEKADCLQPQTADCDSPVHLPQFLDRPRHLGS